MIFTTTVLLLIIRDAQSILNSPLPCIICLECNNSRDSLTLSSRKKKRGLWCCYASITRFYELDSCRKVDHPCCDCEISIRIQFSEKQGNQQGTPQRRVKPNPFFFTISDPHEMKSIKIGEDLPYRQRGRRLQSPIAMGQPPKETVLEEVFKKEKVDVEAKPWSHVRLVRVT
ncbi:uncharacterized protein LOC111087451 [Limulus polyphemus]|uniref:Uncharacterized protein LOC111087451 n=1 Tax=Limulus polyphemus TaxID=6850 RepID=A0ABM1T1Q4_LIMPO|nr:uncharacterized protein LOC111087451 [Limulus polyphemus]